MTIYVKCSEYFVDVDEYAHHTRAHRTQLIDMKTVNCVTNREENGESKPNPTYRMKMSRDYPIEQPTLPAASCTQ